MELVTKASMIRELNTRDAEYISHYVGRALVALFRRQIESEKKSNNSTVNNNRGFSKPDATDGSIGAKYYLKHGKLEDWQVKKWLEDWRGNPRIVKYASQLNEIAIEKRNMRAAA